MCRPVDAVRIEPRRMEWAVPTTQIARVGAPGAKRQGAPRPGGERSVRTGDPANRLMPCQHWLVWTSGA
jgi:hypothetical protein